MHIILFIVINFFSYNFEAESKKNLENNLNIINNFEINDSSNILSLLNDLEGTSIIIKVKNKDNKNIGVFKTNSGNNLAQGEYAMFKLAYLINFNIYPASKLTSLNITSLKKVKTLLENIKFDKFYGNKHINHMKAKENNRLTMIKYIENLIQENKNLDGVFKAWVNNLQFYLGLGTLDNFKKHRIYKYLKHNSKLLPEEPFIIEQCTKLLKPIGCTYGNTNFKQLAYDMSSILVLDSILGNRDRFPGGNLHFYAIDDLLDTKENNTRTYLNSRLFSLDNGAVLKNSAYSNTKLLEQLSISKFVKHHIDSLKELRKNENLKELLKLDDTYFNILINNYDNTLNYIKILQQKYGNKIWFN